MSDVEPEAKRAHYTQLKAICPCSTCGKKGYNAGKPVEDWAVVSYRTAQKHLGAAGARDSAICGERLEQILAGD